MINDHIAASIHTARVQEAMRKAEQRAHVGHVAAAAGMTVSQRLAWVWAVARAVAPLRRQQAVVLPADAAGDAQPDPAPWRGPDRDGPVVVAEEAAAAAPGGPDNAHARSRFVDA
jgi:hypothetical protein